MSDQVSDQTTCADCADLIERHRKEFDTELPEAALHIAVGALYGGGPCDHIDWSYEDAYRAFEALWSHRGRERDRLRVENEALRGLLWDHFSVSYRARARLSRAAPASDETQVPE